MDASSNDNSDNSNCRGSSDSVDGTQSPEPSIVAASALAHASAVSVAYDVAENEDIKFTHSTNTDAATSVDSGRVTALSANQYHTAMLDEADIAGEKKSDTEAEGHQPLLANDNKAMKLELHKDDNGAITKDAPVGQQSAPPEMTIPPPQLTPPSVGDEENALPTPTLETTSPTNNDEEIPSQPQQPATSEVDIPPLQSISNPISDEENLAPNDEENSPPPLLEATLVVESPPVSVVDDEPRVVYMATQVNSSYKKYSIVTLVSLLFGGMATAIAMLVVANSSNNGNEVPVTATLAPAPRPALSPMEQIQSSALELVPSEAIVPHPSRENVAMYGDTLIVGAPNNNNGKGLALVYIRDDKGEWSKQAKLEAPDGANGDRFGWSVAIHGNTVIVGACGDVENGRLAGSAYLFVQNGGTWMHQAKLLPPDGQASYQFGWSVGIFGDTVIIGALAEVGAGSTDLFVQKNGIWTHQAKLTAPDGTANNQFGWSVGIFGDTVIVGAPGLYSESVHLFALNEGIWTHQAALLAPAGNPGHRFGRSVAIFGDTVIVGAPYDDDNNGWDSGSAHVFALNNNNIWKHQVKVLAPDGFADDRFGGSVAIFEDTIVVGSFRDDANGLHSGSLHLFTRDEDAWDYHAKLVAPKPGYQFGQSVAAYNGTVVADSYSGEMYVFSSDSD